MLKKMTKPKKITKAGILSELKAKGVNPQTLRIVKAVLPPTIKAGCTATSEPYPLSENLR